MSSYQLYEFQALDGALSEADQAYLNSLSSRAEVTARLIDPRLTIAMMHAEHRAYYVEGDDTRSASALRAASEQGGCDGEAFDATFGAEAKAAGLDGLAGHRSSGGMRASMYNAFPRAGCEAMAQFMRGFAARNG